jgi:hypothetical protein
MFLKSKKLLIAAMLSGTVSSAFAAGTVSGTNVESTASLSFSVNGTTSTATSTNTFTVDNKVDLTVATVDTQAVSVSPNTTSVVLTFRVQNTGNTVQDYSLSALTTSTTAFTGENAVTDSYDLSNVNVYVDTNGNNRYDEGVDTMTYIDELEPDAQKTVFIVADVPADAANDAIAVYDLQAQTAEGGTADTQGADILDDNKNQADDATTVQIVFADGAGSIDGQYDGKFSSADAWKIVTATVTVSKNSIVISDLVNGTTNPKRIPGAVVRYCYIVSNAEGGADASGAVVTDTLDKNVLSFNGAQVATYTGAGTCDCTTMTDITTGNGPNGQDPDAQGVLKVDFETVAGGETKCGYITATIQ